MIIYLMKYVHIGNEVVPSRVIPRLPAFASYCLHTLNMAKLSVSLILEIMYAVLYVIQLTNNWQVLL